VKKVAWLGELEQGSQLLFKRY